jgi:starch synthase
MPAPLRVLFVTSECVPWSKTGGLADVSAALPAALRALGLDARVLTPAYASVPIRAAREFARFPATRHFPAARVLASELPTAVPALLVESPELYARPGGPYQTAEGRDWDDNAQRFGQLCRIAAALATDRDGAWRPTVVHCNDWQTALVPAYLHYTVAAHAASVLTIHNLAFQGLFPAHVVGELELPAASFSVDGLEFYGLCSFLKGGLSYADALTTVSPTYANEIQSESHGMGLH